MNSLEADFNTILSRFCENLITFEEASNLGYFTLSKFGCNFSKNKLQKFRLFLKSVRVFPVFVSRISWV